MGGGIAATQAYIMSGFTTGNAVLFMGALDIARNIHVTCDFRAAHPVLSGIVDFKVPGSKWRELDRAALLLKVAGGGASCLNKNVVLLTASEQRSLEFGSVKLKLTAGDALMWMTRLDVTGSCSNVSGR